MIEPLIFLYFFTLHADKLALTLGSFTIRANNFVALTLLCYFLIRFRMQFFSFEKKLVKALCFVAFSVFLSCCLSACQIRCAIFCGWLGLTLLCYFFLPYFLIMFFDEKKVLKLYFLSFLCVGIYGFLQLAASIIGFQDPFAAQTFMGKFVRPNGFAYEPSYFALYLTPFVMTANLFYLLGKNREFFVFKELKFKHILLINFLYLASTSTGAFFAYFIFLGLIVASLFFPFIRQLYPSLKKTIVKFGMVCFASSLFFVIIFRKLAALFFMKFFFEGLGHHSFSERWEGIVAAFNIFKKNPFFGVGLGGYPAYLYDEWLSNKVNYLIKANVYEMPNPLKAFEPMNVFTEILASVGLFGMLAFSVLFFVYFLKGKEALNFIKSEEKRDLCFAFFISMMVTFIVLQFNQGVLRTYIWAHFGLTFAFFIKSVQFKDATTNTFHVKRAI